MTPETYEYIIGLLVEELKKKTPKRTLTGQFTTASAAASSPFFVRVPEPSKSFTYVKEVTKQKRARDGKFLPKRSKK